MTWCLHLLYNIVQLAYAYYACSFALHIQSSVFGVIIGYFMRLERIFEQEHQRRWRDALSKRMIPYHKSSPNKCATLTVNPATSVSIKLLTPSLRHKSGFGNIGTPNFATKSATLGPPCKPLRSLSDNGVFSLRPVNSGVNHLPNMLPSPMARFNTLQNPRSLVPVFSRNLNNPNLSGTCQLRANLDHSAVDRARRESPSDITSEHNGNNSDSEENAFLSPNNDNASAGSSSLSSSQSSTYKRVTFSQSGPPRTETSNQNTEQTSQSNENSNASKVQTRINESDSFRNTERLNIEENVNLVVELDSEPTCSQLIGP